MSNKRSRNRKRARRLAMRKTDAKSLHHPVEHRDDGLESGNPFGHDLPKDLNNLSQRAIDDLMEVQFRVIPN